MADWGNFSDTYQSVHFYAPIAVTVNGTQTTFANLESESSLQIRAVTRKTSRGGSRIVAYVADLTLYIPNNEYGLYQEDLLKLQSETLVDLDIVWAGYREEGGFGMTMDLGLSTITSQKPTTLMGLSCEGWTIETVERRPRMIVKFKAIYSKRLFEATILPHFMNY